VLFAVKHLLKDRKPDIVLSGVNRGTNMADDVTYSGTIAGAMEGCLLGIPSIAFSLAYTHPHPVKWGTATAHGADVTRRVLAMDWPRNIFVNVNFPDVVTASVKGTRVTRQACAASAVPSSNAPIRAAEPITGSAIRRASTRSTRKATCSPCVTAGFR
jgi:5'-nucleotidase